MSLTLTLERGGGEVSGSGTNIELDGTIAGGAIESLEMYGDTEQQTYSGKNLYQSIGITTQSGGLVSVLQADGRLRITGQATSNSSNFAGTMTTNLPAGTYTFSITKALPFRVLLRSNDNQNHWVLEAGQTSITQTISSPLTSLWVWGYLLTSGTTYDETVGFMLEAGTPATSFEQYVGGTASPNPDYPQNVQTVTGGQVVTISDGGSESQDYEVNLGKNILDPYQKYSVGETITTNDITYTILDDGGIKVQGTATANANLEFIGTGWSDTTIQIPLDPSMTYVSSITRPSNTYRWYLRGIVNGAVVSLNSNNDEVIIRNCSGITYAMLQITPNNTVDGNVYCQVEKGSTATSFAPYFTPIELCKIGDYQDYIYKSGEDWYVHKAIRRYDFTGSESGLIVTNNNRANFQNIFNDNKFVGAGGGYCNYAIYNPIQTSASANLKFGEFALQNYNNNNFNFIIRLPNDSYTVEQIQQWFVDNPTTVYYPLATPTDTQITNSALIAQLDALSSAQTYDGETVITVGSENLAGPLEVTVATNIKKTYTEVEIGSPFTISDVEGKSSNTTLDGNVYVDWAYNKKQYSFDLFNLTPQDYADIRAFYDYQFSSSAFPTITVPELDINKLPVYMEISSRNIINQCLLTDKLTIKFRETVQP